MRLVFLRPTALALFVASAQGLTVASASSALSKYQSTACETIVASTNAYSGDLLRFGANEEAMIRTFVNEAPTLDSGVLGLEEARRVASSERKASTTPKCEVAWCSELNWSGSSGSLSQLTAWVNPVFDVPHFFSSVGVEDGRVCVCIDFRPRQDAGYDTVLEDGTYPEPTDRDMFMKGSLRKELAERFFTEDAAAWAEALRTSEGAVAATTATVPRETASPLVVDITLPLSDDALAVASSACARAAEMWSGWMVAAERLDQRKTMLVFAHDAKVRTRSYAATTAQLERRVGAQLGAQLAAGDAGPLDQVDRGSSMNAAATTNFSEDEKDLSASGMQTLLDQGNEWVIRAGQQR
jgi:hypothetical protein